MKTMQSDTLTQSHSKLDVLFYDLHNTFQVHSSLLFIFTRA